MDEERLSKFADSFMTHQEFVEMACKKVQQELGFQGYKGKILEAAGEIALFNVLGAVKGSTDIWTTLLKSDLAYEIEKAFDYPTSTLNVFSSIGTKVIADVIVEEWNESKNGNPEQIESDIKFNGLGHAPFNGIYINWEEAGHICPFEYCIKNFPLKEDSEITCYMFKNECPGKIKKPYQNLKGQCTASVSL